MTDSADQRQAPAVAVFDLDGTLVRGDSFAGFSRRLIFRTRLRAAMGLLCAPVLGTMYLVPATRRLAETGFLLLATAGLPPEDFAALAGEYAASHAAADSGNRIPVALRRLRDHLDAGHRVVVATACAEPLASAICRELGLDGVEVVAARLRPGWPGMRATEGCRGLEKVSRLRAAGISTPIAYAYTDSSVDIPLLLAAEHRYVVAPRAGHLRLILAEVGEGCEVLA